MTEINITHEMVTFIPWSELRLNDEFHFPEGFFKEVEDAYISRRSAEMQELRQGFWYRRDHKMSDLS